MSSTFVIFRGEEVEIEFEDRGYEPDVNYWNIEWSFVDERLSEVTLTDEEEESIYAHLAQLPWDEDEAAEQAELLNSIHEEN